MARYTLILGTKDWSSWSLRPYVAIRAVGAPFEEIVVPLRKGDSRDRIVQHSPAAKVPVLNIEDGGETITVWDSLAICETLAERHPDAKLWPDDANARAVARAYAAEMHSSFAALRSTLSMDFARRLPTPDLDDATKADIARILEAWTHALKKYGEQGGFLFGRVSIADAMYAPVVSRFTTYGIAVPGVVKAYMDRMMALPAMQDWGKASQAEVDAGLA
ncbi:MAG TPA: glutathione S-transferase family protein [Rhizomicrobium sp.]|jgi:glutathione S-transferase|nr:glutathione S-transferase family protein [Rhizomicrobium sp.]